MGLVSSCLRMSTSDPVIPITDGNEPPRTKDWWIDTLRRSFTEFVAQLLFVFVGSLAPSEYAALAHGLTIALLVISIGGISGGHVNPVVTLAVTLTKALHPLRAVFYILFQLFGGFIGALFVRIVSPDYSTRNGITTIAEDAQQVAVVSGGQAIIVEVILTYFLVQTVLSAAVDTDGSNLLAPLAVGFAVAAAIFAGGDISGASMNPARSFGPSLAASIFKGTKQDPWRYHYVYWIGPVIGSLIATLFYRLVFAKERRFQIVH